VRIAGVLLMLFGLALALRSGVLLAGRGRPRRGPEPPFVLAGPYLRLRNPLFLGALLACAGWSVVARSAAAAVALALSAIALHVWVTRVEEPALRARFGSAYREYERRVPRWLPARRAHRDEAG
jgi:protein-S-isoprenylcysteine O-methyltransferase Ste14